MPAIPVHWPWYVPVQMHVPQASSLSRQFGCPGVVPAEDSTSSAHMIRHGLSRTPRVCAAHKRRSTWRTGSAGTAQQRTSAGAWHELMPLRVQATAPVTARWRALDSAVPVVSSWQWYTACSSAAACSLAPAAAEMRAFKLLCVMASRYMDSAAGLGPRERGRVR